MKSIIIAVFVLSGYLGMGQVNLDSYKYIIIPKKFDDFQSENQYQTSTFLKYTFVNKGFLAVYDDALPEDLYKDRCLGVTAVLRDYSSMFATKVTIVLEDCRGEEVFSSKEAKNKIKEYYAAYKEVKRRAMSSFDNLNYSYKPTTADAAPITVSFKNDVKKLEEDETVSNTTADAPEAVQKTVSKNTNVAVQQTASVADQSYKSVAPVASTVKLASSKSNTESTALDTSNKEVWYAQPITNGFQLVDSTPKVRMKLLNSSTENVYIAQGEGKSGMVFQKGEAWVFEYYSGAKLIQKELHIKF